MKRLEVSGILIMITLDCMDRFEKVSVTGRNTSSNENAFQWCDAYFGNIIMTTTTVVVVVLDDLIR